MLPPGGRKWQLIHPRFYNYTDFQKRFMKQATVASFMQMA
jgi:hypothetical protein